MKIGRRDRPPMLRNDGRRWPAMSLGLLLALVPSVAGSASATLAQSDCGNEVEPNDAPEQAASVVGAFCRVGTLPDGDQDLFVWELDAADASSRWTISIDGVPGTSTVVQVIPITSDQGVSPMAVGSPLVKVSTEPQAESPTTQPDLLLGQGRYLLGVSRSPLPDGSSPTTFGYALSISPGATMPEPGDAEPNDDEAHASPASGTFSLSGDGASTDDVFAWTLSEADALQAWQLDVLGQVGAYYYLTLAGQDGQQLVSVSDDALGAAHLYDLRLAAGTYLVTVSNQGEGVRPYALASRANEPGQADAEPDDDTGQALPIDPETRVARGRLARSGDIDTFRFAVDEAGASLQMDVTLLWRGTTTRQVCLLDAGGATLQCQAGKSGAVLRGLVLPVGDYFVQVSGDSDLNDAYALRIDPTSPPAPDFEAEPNDSPATATHFTPDLTMRGYQIETDPDVFKVSVSGDPQLWQVDATGDHISQLRWVGADGIDLATADVGADGQSARVTDMYLIPGDFWVRIDGAGDYALSLTALGPPVTGGERESNNVSDAAEPLLMGDTRSGRLAGPTDIDVFRLSLSAPEHIRIDLAPPPDGAIAMALMQDGDTIAQVRSPEVGRRLSYDAQLSAGDYEIWLSTGTPSEQRYDLTVSREDPFAYALDQEPNDTAKTARTLHQGMLIAGSAWVPYDEDWYRLEPLADGAELRVSANGAVDRVELSDGASSIELIQDELDGALVAQEPPIGVPLFLRVVAIGDYQLTANDVGMLTDGGDPSAASTLTAPLPASLAVRLDTSAVAAYWPAGQRVAGTISITNTSAVPLELDLDSVTSHYLWSTELDQRHVTVPADTAIEVPLMVRILPDAWADVPARVTVRARDASGATATGYAELTPSRDTVPSDPVQAWSVPAALLGGLDVASAALGGVPGGSSRRRPGGEAT